MKEREDACTVTWAQYDARVGVRPPKKDTSPSKGSLLARTAQFSALPSARAARPFPFRFSSFSMYNPNSLSLQNPGRSALSGAPGSQNTPPIARFLRAAHFAFSSLRFY